MFLFLILDIGSFWGLVGLSTVLKIFDYPGLSWIGFLPVLFLRKEAYCTFWSFCVSVFCRILSVLEGPSGVLRIRRIVIMLTDISWLGSRFLGNTFQSLWKYCSLFLTFLALSVLWTFGSCGKYSTALMVARFHWELRDNVGDLDTTRSLLSFIVSLMKFVMFLFLDLYLLRLLVIFIIVLGIG